MRPPKMGGEELWQTWSTGEGNGEPLQRSCPENPRNRVKRQKGRWTPKSVGAQQATGDQWRNSPKKNGEMEPKPNNTQLWMWLVMEVKSDAVKRNTAEEPGMLGPWIKQIGSGHTGDGKSEHQHFRNQWTKMDWNGWTELRWPLYLLLWGGIP